MPTEDKKPADLVKEKIQQIVDEGDKKDAMQVMRTHIKKLFPNAKPRAVDVVIDEEFSRRPQRQPKVSEKGQLHRMDRDGNAIDMEPVEYYLEKHGDILPAPEKTDVNAAAIDAAMLSVDNLSAQAQLVRAWGPDRASELLNLVGGKLGQKMPKPDAKDAAVRIAGAPSPETNPWRRASWNITKQGSIVKALGEDKARAIAGAAWGKTKPVD